MISTPSIPGYRSLQLIHASQQSCVYRAVQLDPPRPVVLKLLHPAAPSAQQISQFQQQFTIVQHLRHDSLLRYYHLLPYQQSAMLVMEDYGGISLEQWQKQASPTLSGSIEIAIALTAILAELAQHGIIHRDIKPANILIHPETQQIKLIDFSLASQLPQMTVSRQPTSRMQGTLPYMSPEQTGRMNRAVDYRSDFYSLGITLFELFTGQLPFQATDDQSWIRCHLAQTPPLASDVQPTIPTAIAAIIQRLMAKNAEDRYQSARGIQLDLTHCLEQLQSTGQIAPFDLAQHDRSDHFLIPEKLYGRSAEVAQMLAAYKRLVEAGSISTIQSSQRELLLVTGYAGIGKTSVIQAIYQPIVQQQGRFIQGKFDQLRRNIPYSALTQAFQQLIAQLLAETDANLAQWKAQILAAVGQDGQVLIELIPDLRQIIGPQPAVPILSSTAAQNRFNLLVQRFLQIFIRPPHPLIIFLDDLHWADTASLDLLQRLLAGQCTGSLLVIGAYRHNEVSPSHPLMRSIQALTQAKTVIRTIELRPLTTDALTQLVSDTLCCDNERARPLTDVVNQQTQGNPFFVTQFLKGLHRDGLIKFSHIDNGWQCDLAAVQVTALIDDVIKFMAQQITKLPRRTQTAIQFAACLGNEFNLDNLAIVLAQSKADLSADLWPAIQANLLIPEGNRDKVYPEHHPVTHPGFEDLTYGYRFLHDRVQQAAYQLIDPPERSAIHLRIGQLLRRHHTTQTDDRLFFDIVSHLNHGAALIDTQPELQDLLRLNLQASQRAKSSSAYAIALDYLTAGKYCLKAVDWLAQYQLSLDFYTQLVEVYYLTGAFPQARQVAQIVIDHAHHQLDTVPVYESILLTWVAERELAQAILVGRQFLSQLDTALSSLADTTTEADLIHDVAALIPVDGLPELQDLAVMQDPESIAAMRILNAISVPAYLSSADLFLKIVLTQVKLSMLHGNYATSASAYARYGIVLCGCIGDIERGYAAGKLALSLLDQFDDRETRSRTLLMVGMLVIPWQQHIQDGLPLLAEATTVGHDSGNFEPASLACLYNSQLSYFSGMELSALSVKLKAHSELIQSLKQAVHLTSNHLVQQVVLNLQGESAIPYELDGANFCQAAILESYTANNNQFGLFGFYLHAGILNYLFQRPQAAAALLIQAADYLKGVTSQPAVALLYWYDALIQLAIYADVTAVEQEQLLQRVTAHRQRLANWNRYAPMNFQHKSDLLDAELCRVQGEHLRAMDLYDQAIAGATQHGYIQEAALANELAAKFYWGWGKRKISTLYLQSAYAAYRDWGARAKTTSLEQQYPQQLGCDSRQQVSLNTLAQVSQRSTTSTDCLTSYDPDLATVLQSAQSLSRNLELQELQQQLVQMILERSSAATCLLAMPDQASEWQVVAMAHRAPIEREIPLPYRLDDSPQFPANCMRWVKNTQQQIVGDARSSLPIADPYLLKHQPQSMFCLPILNQQSVLGVIYLEHPDRRNVFADKQQTITGFLCTQAAIALENAQLYHAVQAAEIRAKSLFEQSSDAMILLKPNRIVQCNQAAARLFRISEAALLKLTPADLSPRYQPDGCLSSVKSAEICATVLQQNAQCFEWLNCRPDGTTFWSEVNMTYITYGGDSLVNAVIRDISDRKQKELAMSAIIEDAARKTGVEFYQACVKALVQTFQVRSAFISETREASSTQNQTLAFWHDDHFVESFTYDSAGTPCGLTQERGWCFVAEALGDRFPDALMMPQFSCESYASAAIQGVQGNIIGNIGIVDTQPIVQDEVSIKTILSLFAIRVGAEMDRQASDYHLRQSEARYQQIANNLPGTIFQFRRSADGHDSFSYISSGCQKLLGIAATAVIADITRLTDLVHPDDQAEFNARIAQSAQTLTPKYVEWRAILADGQVKWIKSISRPVRQSDGSTIWDGLMLDITDRKIAEAAVQQSQRRYQRLADNVPGVIYQFKLAADGEQSLPYISPSCLEMFGVTAADLMHHPKQYLDWIHPDDVAALRDSIDVSARNLQPWQSTLRCIKPSGELIWVEAVSRPTPQPDHSVIWDGIAINITDRKITEVALSRSEARYQTIADNFPGVIYQWHHIVDGVDIIPYISSGCYDLFGITAAAAMADSQRITALIHPDHVFEFRQFLNPTDEANAVQSIELRIILASGATKWVRASSRPDRQPDGSIVYDGLWFDISASKQAELEIQTANVELIRAIQIKDEFMATMSHELRTPLNSILGMSEGLREQVFGDLNQRQDRAISTIEMSGQHLLSLINDILDLSKLESGQTQMHWDQVSIVALCHNSLALIKQLAVQKRIRLDVQIAADTRSLYMQLDERRCQQMLINLLANAVKFTPDGGSVTLSVQLESLPPSSPHDVAGFVRFSVIDTGIGIAPENLPQLFQPFVQIDRGLNRRYPGTGLGLALVKRIAEMHSGGVDVTSQVGQGSCFQVRLPILTVENSLLGPSTERSTSANQLSHVRQDCSLTAPESLSDGQQLILLVEDHAANREMITGYLEIQGYQLLVAEHGKAALELLQRHRPPDLILMDIQMPGMDGLEAIRHIRSQPTYALIPIIALTALAMPGDEENCLAAGANAYLTKPIKLKYLTDKMQSLLEPPQS
ncbi:AAA family ATPase [filamentous cyanobacterium LEGE 11480]|uniref:histidine kinase n=1 Tax=Romeriopsis navalis LEGE 11480 TaxID=2777977 RepID=A0A928VNQ7_9CYAN|nr:PAS domain S-box protein [Romeriopsis navalis]MBE9031043.1 AAA family ATPase [Romeriopsis navalis LEGE 11480]